MKTFLTWLWKNKGSVYTAGSIAYELAKALFDKLKKKKDGKAGN